MMSFNNKGGGEGSMSVMTSSTTRRASDIVSDQFPVGLRVLAVDDDVTCLIILEKMLRKCLYEVTTCKRAEVALSLLRENRSGFDIVISDIHIPDMDGFKFLELIVLEMDLPVIMVSADERKDAVMKGVTQGACDFLIKPLRIEAIKNIWQHVIRKRRNETKEMEQSGSVVDGEQHHQILSDDADYASSINNGNWRNSKRRKDEEVEGEDGDDTPTLKRPRVVWTPELHKQFVAAVTQLGVKKAVPKKILELMNVPELTRENVASHLQKYRLFLRRRSGQQQHQNGLGTPFMSPEEVNFRPMPSLDKLDLHALAVSGQLPQKGLATLPAGFGSSTESSGMRMTLVDEKDHFNFETTKLKFGGGQKLSNSSKRLELPPGQLDTMEPKQLAHLHQSVQSLGNTDQHVSEGVLSFLNLPMPMRMSSPIHMDSVHGNPNSSLVMPIAQPQLKGQISYEIVGSNPLSLLSSMDHQISSNDTGSWFLGRDGTGICGGGAIGHPISRALANHATELPGNNFHLRNTAMIPLSQEIEHQNIQNLENTAQRHYCFLVDDFYRLKFTNISDFSSETLLLGQHFAKDDLMDSLLKQTQDDVATVENELNFDEYPNILV